MKHISIQKRLLAALLCFVMIIGMVPTIPWTLETEALDTITSEYVSLPIKVRDYAADGMLFEGNEMGETGTYTVNTPIVTTSTVHIDYTNPANWGIGNYEGIRLCTGTKYPGNWPHWHTIVCNSDGSIYKVYPRGTDASNVMSNGRYAFWVWYDDDDGSNNTKYNQLAHITEANKSEYRLTYSSSTITITHTAYEMKNYRLSNNAGFGLLATGPATYKNSTLGIMGENGENLTSHIINGDRGVTVVDDSWNGTTFVRNGMWGSGYNEPYRMTLNSGAPQTLYGGVIRSDLVEAELGADGRPVYKDSVVSYLANLLEELLPLQLYDPSTDTYNMAYIMGQKLDALGGRDIASVLRDQIVGGMGTLAAAKAKCDAGDLTEITQVETYYEAAHFLLHNIFADSVGYGEIVDCYKEMHLVAKRINDNGRERTVYIFNSGYDDVLYDVENGVIANTQTTNVTYHENDPANANKLRGNPWYANRFNPLSDELMAKAREIYGDPGKDTYDPQMHYGYGYSGDTYRDFCQKPDPEETYYYDDCNYHTSIEGRAQFVYYYDEDLYFSFTGDDDVYLYVNGKRILDVGGAHAISEVRVSLNDVAEICGLEDGKAYDFDFFYMERHGTAANFSIETNIKIVDPSMVTTKDGYQYDAPVGYNGFVIPSDDVIYRFGLQNNGEAPLSDLTFTDETLGVALTPDAITLNDRTVISDLYVTFYNPDGTAQYFENLQSAARLQEILKTGLQVGEKIHIYGFKYLIPDNEWVGSSFVNRVVTTAMCNYENNHLSTRKLTGVADFVVQKNEHLIDPLHIYSWGKLNEQGAFIAGVSEPVTLYKNELLEALNHVRGENGEYITTLDIPDYSIDIRNVPGFAVFPEGYFYEAPYGGALYFSEMGKTFNLGTVDLSQYSSITINYGAREDSTIGSDGGKLLLTANGTHQVGPNVGDYNENCQIIAEERLNDSQGDWYHGKVTMTIPLDSDYRGPLYLAMDMATEKGTPEGVSVFSIILRGKQQSHISVNPETATIHLCSGSGQIDAPNVNKNVVLSTTDYSITHKALTTGVDIYYYMIKDGGKMYGPVPVQVNTYGAADDQFVVDYGLCTNLHSEGGIGDNNVVYLEHNQYPTEHYINKITDIEQYGDFWYDEETTEIHYKLHSFMNGVDSINVRVRVIEDGATELTKFTGVEMTQVINMIPANVMYYEDDFPAIDYKNDVEGLNMWQEYRGPSVSTGQDIDQSSNYGSDTHYATNSSWSETTKPSNYPLANVADAADVIYGDASNDTIHKMDIRNPQNNEILQFEFRGTGFEILSRTTADPYAVLTVKVEKKNRATLQWEPYRMIPVITESIGGDLYQIPIIERKDFEFGDYRVTVYTSNARVNDSVAPMERTVYIDGVRIYQPLSKSLQNTYYNKHEANATFWEIKNQIQDGNIVYGEIYDDTKAHDGSVLGMMFGYTMIESYRQLEGETPISVLTHTQYEGDKNIREEFPLYAKDEYMKYGPNNEIYLRGAEVGANFIAFYLIKDHSVSDAERTIQVGAHVKYNLNDETDRRADPRGAVELCYGSTARQIWDGAYTATIASGTEQYITIDQSMIVEIGGKCLVIIANRDDAGTLSLTNLKLKGYTLAGTYESTDGGSIVDVNPVVTAETELMAILDPYDIHVSTMASQVMALAGAYRDDGERLP